MISNILSALCIMGAVNNFFSAAFLSRDDADRLKSVEKTQYVILWLVLFGLVR